MAQGQQPAQAYKGLGPARASPLEAPTGVQVSDLDSEEALQERAFGDHLQALLSASRPAAEQLEHVQWCLGELQDAMNSDQASKAGLGAAGWKITPFGSSSNGFVTQCSDLDIVAHETRPDDSGEPADPVVVLKVFRKLLQRRRYFNVTALLRYARVPILKMRYNDTLEVDLSVNNTKPLPNTALLRAYSRICPKVQSLGTAVKLWAKKQKLSGAGYGNLSSYSVLLMAIYFMQVAMKPPLPCLQRGSADEGPFEDDDAAQERVRQLCGEGKWSPKESLAEMLCAFFAFYGGHFRWGSEVVSVRLGRRLDADAVEFEELSRRSDRRLHIEDPFILKRNLRDVLLPRREQVLWRSIEWAAECIWEASPLQVLVSTFTPIWPQKGQPLEKASTDQEAVIGFVQTAVPGEEAPGYLSAELGERVKVLYIGNEEDVEERGWLFCQKECGGTQGWIASGSVSIPTLQQVECGVEVGYARAVVPVASHDAGCLALTAGEEVHVSHVGSLERGDCGWVYGTSQWSYDQGWFPAAILGSHRGGPTGGLGHAAMEDQAHLEELLEDIEVKGEAGWEVPLPDPEELCGAAGPVADPKRGLAVQVGS